MSDLIEQRPSRRLWIIAAFCALALHLGGAALAVAHLRSSGLEGNLGASGAEFAVEMASPDIPDNDLPAGPDTEASRASPQLAEQKAADMATDVPKDRLTEAADADRVVTPDDSKRPTEDDPKVAAVQTDASMDQIETARKALDENARKADKARAPNIGLGKDKEKLTADWGRKISAYFKLHQRFPEGKKGPASVLVALVLDRRGKVLSTAVMESSGDVAFDQAAISMIHRSDPVPRPPAGLTDDKFSFNLPVNFSAEK